ncbi:MAG: hypothetical protein BMS9Abin15_1236 [Gammaproteobacteria bacterium]|nr:MAG: hypothetical protein BMS9Abin15_1236 [Gammaproteobacteria bacterium]
MANILKRFIYVLGLLILTGCVSLTGPGAPVEDRSRTSGDGQTDRAEPSDVTVTPYAEEAVQEPAVIAEPKRAAPPSKRQNQAVVALVSISKTKEREGQLDSAAAALERALRIDPNDALLWHQLAGLRLRQRQPGQAESLASKSNALAADNRTLQAKNWRIIEQARRVLGDNKGASKAAKRAKALES